MSWEGHGDLDGKPTLTYLLSAVQSVSLYIVEKPINWRGYMPLIFNFQERSSLLICAAYVRPVMDISISCLSFACLANLQFVFPYGTKKSMLLLGH